MRLLSRVFLFLLLVGMVMVMPLHAQSVGTVGGDLSDGSLYVPPFADPMAFGDISVSGSWLLNSLSSISPSMSGISVNVGDVNGAGLVTMGGTSTLWTDNSIHVGTGGYSGTLTMGDDTVTAIGNSGNFWAGEGTGSNSVVNLSGNAKLGCTWNEMRFGFNNGLGGGTATVTMTDNSGLGNVTGLGSNDCWYINFGEGAGSVGNLDMYGTSHIVTPYDLQFGVSGGVSTANMYDTSTISASHLGIGQNGGNGTLNMNAGTTANVSGQITVGQINGGVGTFTADGAAVNAGSFLVGDAWFGDSGVGTANFRWHHGHHPWRHDSRQQRRRQRHRQRGRFHGVRRPLSSQRHRHRRLAGALWATAAPAP